MSSRTWLAYIKNRAALPSQVVARWSIAIGKQKSYIVKTLGTLSAWVTAILGVLQFLLGGFIFYRRYTKKKLASGLTYIDAYLIMTSIGCGLGRAIDSVVLITDAAPNFMWRQFSSDVSYIPTGLGACIYLCSLISVLPDDSAVHVPPRLLKIALITTSVAVPSLFFHFHYWPDIVATLATLIERVIYSRELIRTLVDAYATVKKDLMSSLGGMSTINDPSPEFKKVYGERDTMMQKAIFKMKYELMFATLWWSKLQAFGTSMGVNLIVLVGMASLAWGETAETVRAQQKGPFRSFSY
ncbi:hypothetical protein DFS34DRAFT_652822 [Phlyctochytrium arcticum]|nr:hypothetical protein DFS34DRAFT_652822 [Phlyctochytrium arcticum]